MAILTSPQLAELRQDTSRDEHPDWNKTIVNAALQSIEDRLEASRSIISADIDTATAPYVFSNAMKKKLFAYFMLRKFDREGV